MGRAEDFVWDVWDERLCGGEDFQHCQYAGVERNRMKNNIQFPLKKVCDGG